MTGVDGKAYSHSHISGVPAHAFSQGRGLFVIASKLLFSHSFDLHSASIPRLESNAYQLQYHARNGCSMTAKTVLPEYKALVDNIPNGKDVLIVWHGMDSFFLDLYGLEIAATYPQETKPKSNILICVRECLGELCIEGNRTGINDR